MFKEATVCMKVSGEYIYVDITLLGFVFGVLALILFFLSKKFLFKWIKLFAFCFLFLFFLFFIQIEYDTNPNSCSVNDLEDKYIKINEKKYFIYGKLYPKNPLPFRKANGLSE